MDADSICTFDLETTSFPHPNTWKYDPTPHNPSNHITASAWKRGDGEVEVWGRTIYPMRLRPFKLLVGHNIKFDLAWLRRHPTVVIERDEYELDVWEYISKHATIWDTALAEYLCSGQTITFPSLAECCKRRGITQTKTLDMKEQIPLVEGDTSKIAGLQEYVKGDVEMTYELFKAQMADPYVNEHFDWFLAQMESCLAEAEIEWNGTAVNFMGLMDKKAEGITNMARIYAEMHDMVEKAYGKAVADHWNIGSNQHVGTLLFGGEFKWEEREEVGKYKSGAKLGQPRYKVHKKSQPMKQLVRPVEMTEGGQPSTSDEALEVLRSPSPLVAEMIDRVRNYRAYAKAVDTTLQGIQTHALVSDDGQMVVRPQMNNTATITGRRSSSKPNGQNYPNNDLLKCKEVLEPRKKGRTIVSIDFKQAEIMALAYVANDEKLIADINSGVDIHENMGTKAYGGRKVSKEERRVVKTVVFGTIYGGGPDTLASQAGVPVSVVNDILDAFSKLYPVSWKYLNAIVYTVQRLLETQGKPTDEVIQTPVGAQRVPQVLVESMTGRRYAFKGYWRNFRKMFHVSLTQPKNYFIQGFATADLVPICVGRVWRYMEHHFADTAEMIGQVHDALIFEVDTEILDTFIESVVLLISDAGNHLASICKLPREWTMPVKCEIEIGTNLGALKVYDYS